jgi:ASC-1-like (ASCH) protein
MKLAAGPFNKIVNGEKTIELRLFDEKRQQLALGDEIVFSENEHPEHTVRTRVKGLLRYPSFKELFSELDPGLFGCESQDLLLAEVRQFYSTEDEQKYGVVGIEIEVVG